jgi:hypothetical protein
MALTKRYQRFEPVTVRAATRLVRMARLGRITPTEVGRYIAILSAIDAHAGERGAQALCRIASRAAALGGSGVHGAPAPFRHRRAAPGCPGTLARQGVS